MKERSFKIIAAIVCLALAGIACSAVSAAQSLAGSNGNNTTSSGGGSSQSALFSDDFSDDTSGWGTGSDANKSVQYSNETLEFQVFKANDMVYSTPNQEDYEDVHVEVKASPNSSDHNTAFGILCDQQVTSDAFYYVAITPAGQYVIAKAAVAKQDVFLTNNDNWASSKLIPVSATSYTVGMDCKSDGTLTLYVNGQQVATATDTTYTSGHVGLFAWSDKKTNSVDVNFDDFAATSLK
jgi:hypothetical protein